MKIRFFNKETGETHIYSGDLCVNSEGQVINLKKNWNGLFYMPGPAGPNIGWEIVNEDESPSLEVQLHQAVSDAVALLNKSLVIGGCHNASSAHQILRNCLVQYADAMMDKPLKPEDWSAIHAKHNKETK